MTHLQGVVGFSSVGSPSALRRGGAGVVGRMLGILALVLSLVIVPIGALADDEGKGQAAAQVIIPWIQSIQTDLEQEGLPANDWTISHTFKPLNDNVYLASIVSSGKTPERHGILRLKWDQQQVALITVFAVEDAYYVTAVDGYVASKAPLGEWHREPGIPDLYSELALEVGSALQ